MKKPYTKRDMDDVSYNPEWSAADLKGAKPFAEAFPAIAATIKPGRPRKAVTKKLISLRLSPEVIEHFKADGPGWQSRIDDALRRIAGRKRKAA